MKNLHRLLLISCLTVLVLLAVSCAKNESADTARTETPAPEGAQPEATQPAPSPLADNAGGAALAGGQAAPAKRPASGGTAATRPAGAASGAAAGSGASGWGDSSATRPAASTAPAQPVLKTYTLPSGSTLRVQTTSTLSSKTVQQGAAFAGSLAEPLTVDDKVIAARGANVAGRVVTADAGGRVKGKAFIEIAVTSLELVNGETVAVETAPFGQEAKDSVKKDAVKVGIASGVGAAIGAIAGGGKGAAIGAGVGAGAGTGAVLATKGEAAVIPAETVINFRTQSPISVKLK